MDTFNLLLIFNNDDIVLLLKIAKAIKKKLEKIIKDNNLVIDTLTIDNGSENYKLPEIESIKEFSIVILIHHQKKVALKMLTGF